MLQVMLVLRSVLASALMIASCTGCSENKRQSADRVGEPTATAVKPSSQIAKREDEPKALEKDAVVEVYRAAIVLEAGEVPFFLEIDGAQNVAMIPGKERFEGRVTRSGEGAATQISISMNAGNGQSFEAREVREGYLEGSWSTYGPLVEGTEFPFVAQRVPAISWQAALPIAGESVDISGSWTFEFENLGTGIADFEPLGEGRYWSRVETKGRDLRAATANATTEGVAIAFFDGYQAWLMNGKWTDGHESFAGTMHYWNSHTGRVTARRSKASATSFVQNSLNRDVTGTTRGIEALRSYQGKPVLLEVGGTWCTSCTDSIPQLRRLQSAHEQAGLAVVSAKIEFAAADVARERVRNYEKRHSLTQSSIVLTDVDHFNSTFAGLPEPGSLPTFYFIGRDGALRAVYTGYMPGVDAKAHASQQAVFDEIVQEIASRPE